MSQTGTVTEVKVDASWFEWKIPDFFSLVAGPNGCFNSPPFTFMSSTWKLAVYPHGIHGDSWISAYLNKDGTDSTVKTVAFSIGMKRANGLREETEPIYHTFEKGDLSNGWSNLWSRQDLEKRKSELAPSGALTFTCRIVNDVRPPTKLVPKTIKLMELETLSTDFKDLYINKNNCDFTLKVKDETFRVHRAVLMARSPVFAAMFKHKMSEKETGVVTVEDCDPDSFGDFLHYLYTGKIEGSSFRNAYHLYMTAEKYQVKELKEFCVSYMKRNLSVENVCDVASLAEEYDDTELQSSGQMFFNQNFSQICSTAEWKKLLRSNYLLSYRLLEAMASTKSKK